jgi:magnesium-transporting ATPase (P-type)
MCYDKTGTLTEEGLDVLGIKYVEKETKYGLSDPACCF